MTFSVEKLAVAMALVALSSITAGSVAIAQEDAEGSSDNIVDVTALTCRDLLLMDNEDEQSAIMFVQGYLSGKNGDVEINVDALRAASDRSFEQCIDEPDSTMMSVFEQNR